MTSSQLGAEQVHEHAVRDDPSEIKSGSGWLAWLLGHGYEVGNDTAVELGFSRATVNATVHALKQAGWLIDTTADGRKVSAYHASRRPDGSFVIANPNPPPPPPAGIVRKPRKPRNAIRKPAAPKKVAPSNGKAPAHPALGAQLRVGMLADQNGTVVLALHDDHGQIWWARLDAAPM